MTERVTLTEAHDDVDRDLQVFDVKGIRIAVAKVNGTFYAFDNNCTPLQCSLDEGKPDGSTVTCPCPGNQSHRHTGAVRAGPARARLWGAGPGGDGHAARYGMDVVPETPAVCQLNG
mgnify:CR=1 FL=1